MRYSLEPTYREYVKEYGFLSFARNFGDKYGKKLMNTATKVGNKKIIEVTKNQGSELAKTVQKSAEATGDLINNKKADKITSLGKSKNKENKMSKEEIIIPPEKRQQIIIDLRLF